MVKATEGVYKYVKGEFAVKHKKDGFKAGSIEVLIGYVFNTYSRGRYPDQQTHVDSFKKRRLQTRFRIYVRRGVISYRQSTPGPNLGGYYAARYERFSPHGSDKT